MKPVAFSLHEDEQIQHFSLNGLLPEGHELSLNTTLGTLSLLASKDGHPRMWMEQKFTVSEICVLMPLLDAHPYYCPYEVLLASFNSPR